MGIVEYHPFSFFLLSSKPNESRNTCTDFSRKFVDNGIALQYGNECSRARSGGQLRWWVGLYHPFWQSGQIVGQRINTLFDAVNDKIDWQHCAGACISRGPSFAQ